MCMTAASAHPTKGSFVASDTRFPFPDGSFVDPGGRVFSTGSGWAAGTGWYDAFEVSRSALIGAGPITEGEDPTARALGIVNRALLARGIRHHVKNVLLLIEPFAQAVVIQNGEAQPCDYTNTCPGDLGMEYYGVLFDAMSRSIEQTNGDLAARILAIAPHFERVSRASAKVSNVMEIGYLFPTPDGLVRGFLRAKAADIALSKPGEIFERFQAAPLSVAPLDAIARGVIEGADPTREWGSMVTNRVSQLLGETRWLS